MSEHHKCHNLRDMVVHKAVPLGCVVRLVFCRIEGHRGSFPALHPPCMTPTPRFIINPRLRPPLSSQQRSSRVPKDAVPVAQYDAIPRAIFLNLETTLRFGDLEPLSTSSNRRVNVSTSRPSQPHAVGHKHPTVRSPS
jgi:hypothetical protein